MAPFIGQLLVSLIAGQVLNGLIRTPAGTPPVEKPKTQEKDQTTMSYGIMGNDEHGLIGLEEIIGSDLYDALNVEGEEIVGAVPAQLRQAIAARSGKALVQTSATRLRRQPLGVTPTSVAAGATATIPCRPQNTFRPERFVVPSDIASDFGLVDIKVGTRSQFAEQVEVPAAVFSEVAIDTNVQFDTANVGHQISVQCRNKTAAAIEFSAAFIGSVAV